MYAGPLVGTWPRPAASCGLERQQHRGHAEHRQWRLLRIDCGGLRSGDLGLERRLAGGHHGLDRQQCRARGPGLGSNRTLNISGPAGAALSGSLALTNGNHYLNDLGGKSILSGVLSGTGGLTYQNLGTASGFNTYTGGTTLPGGSNPTITNRGALAAA